MRLSNRLFNTAAVRIFSREFLICARYSPNSPINRLNMGSVNRNFVLPVSFLELSEDTQKQFFYLLEHAVREGYFEHLQAFDKMPKGDEKKKFYATHFLIAKKENQNFVEKYLKNPEDLEKISADYDKLRCAEKAANAEYMRNMVFDENPFLGREGWECGDPVVKRR